MGPYVIVNWATAKSLSDTFGNHCGNIEPRNEDEQTPLSTFAQTHFARQLRELRA
jgi:hypothetical protein